MKKTLITFLLMMGISITHVYGQIADGITYQAVALDDKGKEIAGHDINGLIIHSKEIGVRFSIVRSTLDGENLYVEKHSTSTDQFGLFTLIIGHGEVSSEGKFQKMVDINWGADKLFLKVEIDIRNTGDFKVMGIQQMMAVPFAFHSLTTSKATVNYSDILGKPALSSVVISGSYNDLVNKPTLFTGSYIDLTNKPLLFDGNFNSLTNKPSIPSKTSDLINNSGFITSFIESDPVFGSWNKSTGISIVASQVSDFQSNVTNNSAVLSNTAKNSYPATDASKLAGIEVGAEVNVNADWNSTSGDAMILNKPSLARVATTGNYTDLLGLPTIPAQYTDAMADLRIIAGISGKVDKVSGKGLSTNDYTNSDMTKLAGISAGAEVNVNADWQATSGDAQILNKPLLSTVAISGSYNDLNNKPVNLSEFTNDVGYIKKESQTLTLEGNVLSISGGNSVTLNLSASLPTFENSQTFGVSGTFTVPAGITLIAVEVWSAGGSGANGSSIYCLAGYPSPYHWRGAGGGGGAYGKTYIRVIPGETVIVTVGKGGIGGNGSSYSSMYCSDYGFGGTNGGSSSFGNYLSLLGGTAATGNPGGGNMSGNAGTSYNGTGGSAGGEGTGYGGYPPNSNYPPATPDGRTPGGGGSGGNGKDQRGGNGGDGLVVVWY